MNHKAVALERVADAARDLEAWLRKTVKTEHVAIKCDDIGGEGTRQRLQALHDALKQLDAEPVKDALSKLSDYEHKQLEFYRNIP